MSGPEDRSKLELQENPLAKWLEQGAAIAWLGQRALSEPNLDVLFADTLQLLQRTLDADCLEIRELKAEGRRLVLRAGLGWDSGIELSEPMDAPSGDQDQFVLASPEPVMVTELATETRFRPRPTLLENGVASGICAGIKDGGTSDPFGLLGVYFREPRSFSPDDSHFISAVSAFMSSAVRLYRAEEDREARALAETLLTKVLADSRQHIVVMEAANRVALDILSSRTGTEALRHIAEAARVLGDARYAALGVAHPDKPGLEDFIVSGLTPDQEAVIGHLPAGRGILGLLLERERPLRISKMKDHPNSAGFPPNHPVMDSFLGVPIRRGDKVLGSLYLTNKQNGTEFTEADEIAVSALGAHAAIAIYNLRQLSHQRDLTRSLITAQEEERRAVAHDLHDGLTQYVMAAQAHFEAFKRASDTGNAERAAKQADQGLTYLKQAVVESRRMINNLRLLVLDDLGLTGALEQLVKEEKTRAGWETAHLEQDIGDERFDVSIETAIYRVVQEGLNNVRKHSGASRVLVSVHKKVMNRVPVLELVVQDWGTGFAVKENLGAPGHYGLQGMMERIHLLNGSYDIESEPGQGTRVTASFPI